MESLKDLKDMVIKHAARRYIEKRAFNAVQSALAGTAFHSAASSGQDKQRYDAILNRLNAATAPKTAADKEAGRKSEYNPSTGQYSGGPAPQFGQRKPQSTEPSGSNFGPNVVTDAKGKNTFEREDPAINKLLSALLNHQSPVGTSAQSSEPSEDDLFNAAMPKLKLEQRLEAARSALDRKPFWTAFADDVTGRGAKGRNLGGMMAEKLLTPLFSAPGQTASKILEAHGLAKFGPRKDLGDRQDPLSMAMRGLMEGGSKTLGAGVGEIGAALIQDMAAKAITAVGGLGANSARKAILDDLRQSDPILSQPSVNPSTLMEAYHTMVKFAPTLATDKNAVRSFLRTAVQGGGGVDFNTIRLIADAEHSVAKEPRF